MCKKKKLSFILNCQLNTSKVSAQYSPKIDCTRIAWIRSKARGETTSKLNAFPSSPHWWSPRTVTRKADCTSFQICCYTNDVTSSPIIAIFALAIVPNDLTSSIISPRYFVISNSNSFATKLTSHNIFIKKKKKKK